MGKIKQLSAYEAQKIAAGQVVERPVNIVKELVENAIDAGATQITLYVNDGGKIAIRIIDNGSGMDKEDALNCFSKHATSKIERIDDLATLQTFGFRGEALASISAIAKVVLRTKLLGSDVGTQVAIGSTIDVSSVGCAQGTDIVVSDLFYNVPARKKFLKATNTEWRHIQQLMHAFCLSHQTIHFKVFCDDILVINSPSNASLKERTVDMLPHSARENLMQINRQVTDQSISVEGLITNHQYGAYDRSNIYIFVNNRWVKNYKLSAALLKGYENALQPGKYPFICCKITVDPAHVDVNVSPKKEEVAFLHAKAVENACQKSVNDALQANVSQNLSSKQTTFGLSGKTDWPEMNFRPAHQSIETVQSKFNLNSEIPLLENNPEVRLPQNYNFDEHSKKESIPLVSNAIDVNASFHLLPHPQSAPFIIEERHAQVTMQDEYSIIGQLAMTYILVEKPDGLYIIDQHAAHERILYEQFADRFISVNKVRLLFAHIIPVAPADLTLLVPHFSVLIDHGIDIEQFGDDQVIIQATPVYLKDCSMNDIVDHMVAWVKESGDIDAHEFSEMLNHKLRAQMACKSAVKAGDGLNTETMQQIINDLLKIERRLTCPHGRPTTWLLSKYEIEKNFKRKK